MLFFDNVDMLHMREYEYHLPFFSFPSSSTAVKLVNKDGEILGTMHEWRLQFLGNFDAIFFHRLH